MIAIISDVHGNYPALRAVMDEIHKYSVDQIISLGDIAGYYCFINECIGLCRSENVLNLLGNHDHYLVSGTGCPRSYSANLCLDYQKRTITEGNLNWLKNSVAYLDLENVSMRHGGWGDPLDEYLYDFSFSCVRDRHEKIFVSGHTHRQVMKQENEKIYVNPGAVGQPRDYIPTAGFALINDNGNVTLHRVPYPICQVLEEMKKQGFPDRISECLLSGTKIGEI